MDHPSFVEHFMPEISRLRAECDSLRQYIAALSAIIDMQELPKAIDASDYRRLLRDLGIRKHRKRVTS